MKWASDLWENTLQFISTGQGRWLGEWVFNKEMAQESMAALVVFVLGWLASLRISRDRQKARVIDELVLSQRELFGRAYPELRGGRWERDGDRQVWMLEPFVGRIRFLVASLEEDGSLGRPEMDALESYTMAVEAFIVKWSITKNRGIGYHAEYNVSYRALFTAIRTLGANAVKRTRGLKPRDEILDSGGEGGGQAGGAAAPLFATEKPEPEAAE